MKLTLIGIQAALCDAWMREFAGTDVEVIQGDFRERFAHDCIVSPANSFGLMDGGIDLAYVQFFGEALQRVVRSSIDMRYRGEQPVGTSLIVPIPERACFLAHTPTMRVPMCIHGTDAVYVAMRAVLLEVIEHNLECYPAIKSVMCPGLGTGAGGVPADVAAKHMRLAYDSVMSPPQINGWAEADAVHNRLGIGRP
jgi:O-acetyl-ADP-ribose deacetylase (regulator of RNase III)